MINILEIESAPNDACSFYRGREPFSKLMKDNFVNLIQGSLNSNWSDISYCDIVFLQRPSDAKAWNIISMAKNMGKKVLIDFDDDILHVPEYYKCYNQFKFNPYIINIIKNADEIITTTEELKKVLAVYNVNVTVIPNCLNDDIFKTVLNNEYTKNKLVFWRGGENHAMDLFTYYEQIFESMEQNKDWSFSFMGDEFDWQILNRPSNYCHIEHKELTTYYWYLHRMNPGLSIVPLIKNKINLCRSNIAWIESTYAGAVNLIPDWGDFKDCPGIHYETPEEFKNGLNDAIKGNYDLKTLNDKSWQKITDELLLSKWNDKRKEIIEYLMS
jgi:hypothetical protein